MGRLLLVEVGGVYSHDEILEAVDGILMEALGETVNRVEKMNLTSLDEQRLSSIKKFLENRMWEHMRRINRPVFEGGRRRPDAWFFGGALVLEVKVDESEFKEGLSQLKDYVREYFRNVTVRAIITNGLRWDFYSVSAEVDGVKFTSLIVLKANDALFNESIEKAVKESQDLWDSIVKTFEDIILRTQVYAYTPEPENIRRIFYPLLFYVDDLAKVIREYLAKDGSAIYNSYVDIMRKLYAKLKDEEIAKLLAIHTIIQVIVNAILSAVLKVEGRDVEVCSGELFGDFDVTVPHLIWWRGVPEAEVIIVDLCKEARNYTYLFNWSSQISIDVFSHLYEDFVERTLRYRIGEYYTPWWLIELIVERLKALKADTANSIILDPACGSGRFLVAFFHKKLEDGVKADEAYYSLIGIDVNPLAVSIARAELIIAYRNRVGSNPKGTPLIFWSDSLAPFIKAPFELVDELNSIQEALTIIYRNVLLNYLKLLKGENENIIIMLTISRIERLLASILKSLRSGQEVGTIIRDLEEMKRGARGYSAIAYDVVIELLRSRSGALVKLLSKYGNGVWAIPITSSLAVIALYSYLKPDIVTTNPPWLELNELPQSKWGVAVREYVRGRYLGLPLQVYQKGDLSLVFLDIALQMVRKGGYVGFVLPADQSYSGAASSYGAGKIFTLKILEKNKCSGEIIYVGNAFGHGQNASMVCLRRGEG
jgi:hypothetical protein